MIMSPEQIKEFREIVRPVMKYLAAFYPHVKILLSCDHAEFVEGVATEVTDEFVKD